ncbi:hypothetical protein C8R47DRAFT_285408 [Mycena vitilis]|nr:hypothetical protein C8R47DRAFT_285408 [Mycena vitilis]
MVKLEEENTEGMLRDLQVRGEDAFWYDNVLKLRCLPEPVSSILLARECDTPSILPFAFLHLLRCRFESDVNDFLDCSRRADHALLSSEDSHRLILARERIGKWFYHDHSRVRWKHCGQSSCQATILRTRLAFATAIARDGDLLQCLPVPDSTAAEICSPCQVALKKGVEVLMQDFVGNLGTFFQLS